MIKTAAQCRASHSAHDDSAVGRGGPWLARPWPAQPGSGGGPRAGDGLPVVARPACQPTAWVWSSAMWRGGERGPASGSHVGAPETGAGRASRRACGTEHGRAHVGWSRERKWAGPNGNRGIFNLFKRISKGIFLIWLKDRLPKF
jgi:hypothetical protein